MQDGATCHTAAGTMTWLTANNVDVLPWWPANSPDLNPIENVWAWMERKLRKRVCRTDDELWGAVKAAWDEVPMTLVKSLYESVPGRLKKVRKNQGRIIKY
jgi:hypothetical protein